MATRCSYLMALPATAGLLASLGAAPRQRCDEPRYRWSMKTDTSLASRPATATTIANILTRWTPLPLGPADRCAARTGHELNLYVVPGWIRRSERKKADGDWHLELTAAATSPPESCIVAEIPLGALGVAYRRARGQLNELLAGGTSIGTVISTRRSKCGSAALLSTTASTSGRRASMSRAPWGTGVATRRPGRCGNCIRSTTFEDLDATWGDAYHRLRPPAHRLRSSNEVPGVPTSDRASCPPRAVQSIRGCAARESQDVLRCRSKRQSCGARFAAAVERSSTLSDRL